MHDLAANDEIIRFRIPPALLAELRRKATARHVTIRDLARVALGEGLRVFPDDMPPTGTPPAQAV